MITTMLGKITLFPYDFAPSGWMFCEGQAVPISENEALFTMLGNTFGGDGENTFGLPDLRSITPANCHYCIAVQGDYRVMQYEGLVGETFLVPFQSQARDLVECTGQSVPDSRYFLLKRLMGTRFGGGGGNFNLPDLRSTTPKGHRTMMAVDGFDPNSGSFGALRNPYVGELVLMPYDAVENFILCDGTQLGVKGNEVLYNLLGNRFGGDAQRFAVPDLRSKAPAKFNYFLVRRGVFPQRP